MAKWPVLARNDHAATWLQAWEDLGRAPGTLDAYARGLAEYLVVCEREAVDPLSAGRTHVGVCGRELTSRPHRRGANVVSIESGAGLANATIQQRLVPVRLFYDFLAKDNLQKMAVSIPLTEDEQAAVTDGQTAIDRLLGRLADTPTPAGPTPRQITTPDTAQLLPIVELRQGKQRKLDKSDSTEKSFS